MTHWHLTVGTFICDSKSCFESKEVLASPDTLMVEEISYHRFPARNKSPAVVAGSQKPRHLRNKPQEKLTRLQIPYQHTLCLSLPSSYLGTLP